MDGYLEHYGMPRRSGRYPWGSGENPYQHESWFLKENNRLKKEGLTEKQRAEILIGPNASSHDLRARITIEKGDELKANIRQATELKEKGYSTVKIGEMMGRGESTVRNWLKPGADKQANKVEETAELLKEQVDKKGYVDVGYGSELYLNTTENNKKTALKMLESEGYKKYTIKVEQLGTGHFTTIDVLAPPGTEFGDVIKNKEKIRSVDDAGYIIDVDGTKKLGALKPKSLDSSRVYVNYAEDGGKEKDGVIELRRGVDDISLGKANYAQVRIAVDGTHYLKGMAMYSDNIPDGYDIIFNTNKHKGTPKLGPKENSVLKPLESDPDNPFKTSIKMQDELRLVQSYYLDKNGKKQQSVINVVNEEGDWDNWSKTLSSQFLSKQNLPLIKKQLNLSYAEKLDEYQEIKELTNPTIKRKLLNSFADNCDSAAVHLKAAALPRQSNSVILPITSLKENEIFAPRYRTGEPVVLVRHPHGGIFEIPELVVNNNNREAKRLIKTNSPDAVGINHKVAERLSGADFDGDTVLVIPTTNVKIKTAPKLKALDNFDPKEQYQDFSLPKMKSQTKQTEMGKVSNLITDMTLKNASMDEIARAVKHSMVVIDAEKHSLDYKRSAQDNRISELKKTYQGGEKKGASTLISKASSEIRIDERKKSYKPDPETGKYTYTNTEREYVDKNGKTKKATQKITRMEYADDAFELSSGTPQETEYAIYANKMKSLANSARKELMSTPNLKYNPSAKETYSEEVASLNTKLNAALKNAPKERQAQLRANYIIESKKRDNPELKDDRDKLSKEKNRALAIARAEVGAKKDQIEITDREWDAIQSGAISDTKLTRILDNTDLDSLKKRATPRQSNELSSAKKARIKSMANSGYTLSDISDALGVSATTVSKIINE